LAPPCFNGAFWQKVYAPITGRCPPQPHPKPVKAARRHFGGRKVVYCIKETERQAGPIYACCPETVSGNLHESELKNKKRKIATNIAQILFAIAAACFGTFLLYAIGSAFQTSNRLKIESNQCSTRCTIIDVKPSKGSWYVLFDYVVNGETLSDRKAAPYGAFPHATYILNYECNDPSNTYLLDSTVFFNPSDLHDTLSTRPLKVSITEYFIQFSFVDQENDTISHGQELRNSLIKKIRTGECRVLYLKSDPTKAILW
jgi:hypothetical protein